MHTDKEAALKERVRNALRFTRIEDAEWEDAKDTEHVQGALDQPSNPRAFEFLKDRIQRLRERFQPRVQRRTRRAVAPPMLEHAYTPYVVKMTEALGHQAPEDHGFYVPGLLDPILSWVEGGCIGLQVEPWVPAKSVTLAFRGVQDMILGGKRNRSVSAGSLDRYLWIRRRREEAPGEGWRRTMAAWNRDHKGSRYESVRNFRQAFVRTEEFVRDVESICRAAREWEQELS